LINLARDVSAASMSAWPAQGSDRRPADAAASARCAAGNASCTLI